MILLDTDHLSVISNRQGSRHDSVMKRLQGAPDQPFATTVVCVEEQCRGWLARIKRLRTVHEQIPAYERLRKFLVFLREWEIVPFDNRAADEFERLRKQRIRIGTQDLKIASIALTQGALLLSANLRDFKQVPDLRIENWLE
jgi:tRNA(fMet)-specific endonuclease VapC